MTNQTVSTQQAYPWRATARTVLQLVVALAAAAPVVYQAITNADTAAAAGGAAVALSVAAAVTRVMALPIVDQMLARVGLGSTPKPGV
jgi:hypothetical protein